MPRTAITVGTLHKGGDELISGPSVPFLKQAASFRELAGTQSHPKFSMVQYQESDQTARIVRFRNQKEQEQHEAARAAEQKAFEAAVKVQQAKDATLAKASAPKSKPPVPTVTPKTENNPKSE